MADVSAVTVTLPAAMGLAAACVSAGIGGVVWLTREIRGVGDRIHAIDVRVTRIEARHDYRPAPSR